MLAPLPDDLRLVLRRTAVLDEFGADLATAVTGRPDAPELLARAEREQLFVVPLDDRGDWYRFHHLFTEVLRDDLARTEPDLVPRLHARAARWLAATTSRWRPSGTRWRATTGRWRPRWWPGTHPCSPGSVRSRPRSAGSARSATTPAAPTRGSPSPAPSPARTPGGRTRSSRGPPSPSGLSTTRRGGREPAPEALGSGSRSR